MVWMIGQRLFYGFGYSESIKVRKLSYTLFFKIVRVLNNVRESSGKRPIHFDIKLICVKDLIGNDDVKVECCRTERIISDYE